jgi:8-oxo-dGTP diphosphatase
LGRERPIPKVKTGEAVSSGPEGLGAPRVFLERSETVTRSGVWLGVGGLVRRGDSVLAVKKRYGATKGLWTMPGGFVAPGETLDEAVVREIREETGVETAVCGVIAVRTGVLRTGVSDNLVLFSMKYLSGEPEPDGRELSEARFLSREDLLEDPTVTELLRTLALSETTASLVPGAFHPRRDFGYRSYKIFREERAKK